MEDYISFVASVEDLISDFYRTCSNERRREIENQLIKLRERPDFDEAALHLAGTSKNTAVTLFLLQGIQVHVERLVVRGQSVQTVRDQLLHLLGRYYNDQAVSIILTNKTMKIIATIVCFDWTDGYAASFGKIIEIINNSTSTALGLMLGLAVLEEYSLLSGGKFSAVIKEPVRYQAFCGQTKNLLSICKEVLWAVLADICSRLFKLSEDTQVLSEECRLGLLNRCWRKLSLAIQKARFPVPHPVRLADMVTVNGLQSAIASLNIAAKSMQVMPVQSVLDVEILGTIIPLILLGMESSRDPAFLELTTHALSAFNEHLRAPIPIDSVYCATIVDCQAFMYESVKANAEFCKRCDNNGLKTCLVENIRIFLQHKLAVCGLAGEKVLNLLESMFSLLFSVAKSDQETAEKSFECWLIFFDYLSAKLEAGVSIELYHPLLDSMANGFFRLLLLSNNESPVCVEFGIVPDFVEDSEWHQFAGQILELLSKLGELRPMDIFAKFHGHFEERVSNYLRLEEIIRQRELACSATSSVAGGGLDVMSHQDLLPVLLDLQILMKGLEQLSHGFISKGFWDVLVMAKDLVERLCQAAVYSGRLRLYTNATHFNTDSRSGLTHVFAGILLCLKSYCHWMAQYYAEAQRLGDHNQHVSAIITACVDTCVSHLDKGEPEEIITACVSTLHSVLTTVRPQYILGMPTVSSLYAKAEQLTFKQELNPKVSTVLHCSLCQFMVLPWYNAVDCEQEWPRRYKMFKQLVLQLIKDYSSLCGAALEGNMAHIDLAKANDVCEDSSHFLSELLNSIANEGNSTKKQVHRVLKSAADGTLAMLIAFEQQPNILEHVMSILHSLFVALPVQLGSEFVQKAMKVMIHLINSHYSNNSTSYDHSQSVGSKTVGIMLKILNLVTREMSKHYSVFTESIVQLALNNLGPYVIQSSSTDVKSYFYELMYSLLEVRWRYFSAQSVASNKENSGDSQMTFSVPTPAAQLVDHGDQLIAVLMAIVEGTREPTPNLIKQNLNTLVKINDKWNLFKKPIFLSQIYKPFVMLALDLCLSSPEHSLVIEDIINTLAQMSLATPESLHVLATEFLPEILSQKYPSFCHRYQSDILERLCKEQALPSLCLEFQRLVYELQIVCLGSGLS